MTDAIEPETKEPLQLSIQLDVYDWQRLLNVLERNMCMINDDDTLRTRSIELWEKISTQISGCEQVMYGSGKHHRICPAIFTDEHDLRKTEPMPVVRAAKKSLWSKIFG